MADHKNPLNLDRSGPIWSWFDADLYARNDAPAARAAKDGAAAALADYLERGSTLNYAPNLYFDPRFYLEKCPDVADSLRTGEIQSAYEHFASGGYLLRDSHWLFDLKLYGRLYPDLTEDAVDADGGLFGHYLLYGNSEGRRGHHLFDSVFYLAQLPPSVAAAAMQRPFSHFLESLANTTPERRTSPYFDPTWYLATYPSAASDLSAEKSPCALHHYIMRGSHEGYDPLCDFSEVDYCRSYPDVAEAVQNGHFVSGFHHFLEYGVRDPRSPSKDIDLAWYASLPQVARDMEAGLYDNVFEHLIRVGLAAGLPLQPPVSNDFALQEPDTRKAFISQAQRALLDYGREPLDFTTTAEAELTVIIILRNQFALTMQCLASLRQTFAGQIQLVVVDNASNDGTTEIGDLVRGANIIRSDANIGFLRACNLALQHATAPAVLYLNNDVVLHPTSVELALKRLWSEPTIGAVGGKIIRTHGLLQEAGCILWRDGGTEGWLRDEPPDVPEANFVRDVDFCSGCFLLVRGDLLARLGGFDDAFAPAYYEEADLCLRIQHEGYRVVYEPRVSLTHLEYASSRSVRAATSQMVVNRAILRRRHAEALRRRAVDRLNRAEAAAYASRGRRILFIEDTVPLHRLGSGYGRAADVLASLVEAGWQASVFPMVPVVTPIYQLTASLPDSAEVLWDRDKRSLKAFLNERRGYYDLIWVSRAHNLRQLHEIVGSSSEGLGEARVVLDTEAVFSVREACLAKLNDLPFDLPRALGRELENAWLCDHVVAVSQAEAELISTHTGRPAGVVGFRQVARPLPTAYADRRGILHVGALTSDTSPNYDGLRWYLTFVQPVVEHLLGRDAARLTVVGHSTSGLDLSWLDSHPNVELLGSVADLTPLYARHRVFVAPTRFAAGLPVKVLEAASFGLPVACTALLAGQLGWRDREALVCGPETDPDEFAAAIAALYGNMELWERVRAGALQRIALDAGPDGFAAQLAAAVSAAGLAMPRPKAARPPMLHSVETASPQVEHDTTVAPTRSKRARR